MEKENYQILNEQEKFEQYADKEAIIRNMKNSTVNSYNASFLYPKNGAGSFIEILYNALDKEKVLLNTEVKSIDFNAKTYFFCGNNYIEFLEDHFPNGKSMYAGKGIGEIMHWLDKKLGNLKESFTEWMEVYGNDNDVEKYIE